MACFPQAKLFAALIPPLSQSMACNLLIFIVTVDFYAVTQVNRCFRMVLTGYLQARESSGHLSPYCFAWHRPTIEYLDRMQQQINLFQPIFRKERKILSFAALIQISGIFITALVVLYGLGLWQNSRINKELAGLKKQHDERIAMLERVSRKVSKLSGDVTVDEEVARLEAELAAERYIVSLLSKDKTGKAKNGKSGEAVGFSQYLEIFSRRVVQGMWISQFSVYDGGDHMLIKGGALSADLLPKFLQGLSAEPLLNGMEFRVLQMSRKETNSNWIEFALSSKELPDINTQK